MRLELISRHVFEVSS